MGETAPLVIGALGTVWMRNAMRVAVRREAAAEIVRIWLRANKLIAEIQIFSQGSPSRHRSETGDSRQRREQAAAREGKIPIRVP